MVLMRRNTRSKYWIQLMSLQQHPCSRMRGLACIDGMPCAFESRPHSLIFPHGAQHGINVACTGKPQRLLDLC